MQPSGSAEAEYAKATTAELARDWDAAFAAYVSAAERYLHASRTAPTEQQRASARNGAGKALRRAELIKKARSTVAPAVRDAYSPEEQARILERASIINRQHVIAWDDPRRADHQDFSRRPPLSQEQVARGAVWRKISGIAITFDEKLVPQDIVQRVVTDCSVCASVAVCIEHRRRFGSKLGDNILTSETSGHYLARLFFNGTYRRIAIDDALPVAASEDWTPLCMSTRCGIYTPTLIEKAYLKLMGGYDFPGSISSSDLHALLGWIPEHVDLQSPDFQPSKTWERILTGFRSGKCLMTLGTGAEPTPRWRGLHLLEAHCYAVIDVEETDDGERMLTLLDSRVSTVVCAVDVVDALQELDLNAGIQNQPNEIRVSYEDAIDAFHGLYVSWDPTLFRHKLTFHGAWRPTGNEEESYSASYDLHLKVQSTSEETEVWILLTRHVSDTRAVTEFVAVHAQIRDSADDVGALQVAKQVSYTNGAHVLLRMPLPILHENTHVAIAALYEGISSEEVGFSLTVYGHAPLSWRQDVRPLPFSKKITGALNSTTAGGNSTFPTWMNNPQYKLHIPPSSNEPEARAQAPAKFIVNLRGARELPLNLTIAWGEGERIFELAQNDVVLSSGAYAHGFASATTNLRPGEYTLIVSAFEPRQQGTFTINVESARAFDLTPLPAEGAGMYSKTVRGQWMEANAAGGPSFGHYDLNPTYEVRVPSACNLKARLQLIDPAPTAALNITLFECTADGRKGKHVATSGPYTDAPAGVRADATVNAGSYLLVCSTYGPGVLARFRLFIYSSTSGVNVSMV